MAQSLKFKPIGLILALTNTPSLNLMKIVQNIKHSYATPDEPAAVLPVVMVYQRKKWQCLGILIHE